MDTDDPNMKTLDDLNPAPYCQARNMRDVTIKSPKDQAFIEKSHKDLYKKTNDSK